MENLSLFYQDLGTSSLAGGHLTQEEAAKDALAIRISQKFALLEKVRITTLIAKFLILDIPIDRDAPIVVGQGFLRTIGGIVNTLERLFLTFDGLCHQTFCAPAPYLNCNDLAERSLAIQTVTNPFQKISVWKKAVSFLGSLPVPLKHVNWKLDYKGSYTKEEEEATGQWRTEISKKSDQVGIKEETYTIGTHDDEVGSSRSKRSRQNETVEEVLLPHVHHEFLLWEGCNRDVKSRMGCDGEIDDMLRIRLRDAKSNEEIFTSKIIKFRLGGRAHGLTLLEFARRLGLYHVDELEEDYFNVYFKGGLRSDDHFNAQDYWLSISPEDNLGLSRSHTSTIKKPILRVIHKLITYGLCQRTTGVLTEDAVRSLSAPISCRDLDTTTLRDLIDSDGKLIPEDPQLGVPRVGIPRPPRASMQDLYDKMESVGAYGWGLQCSNFEGDSQIDYLWFVSEDDRFISKIARKCRVLTEDVVRSLSAPISCRDLDTTTLRDLIDSDGKLIPEDPQLGVPRVGIPRPPRASM
ncbi:hypothetical protein Tco_1234348 [Tanacetum coccineum]